MSSRLKPDTFDWGAAHAFGEWQHDLKILERHGPVALKYEKKAEQPPIKPFHYCEQYPCYMIQDMVGGSLMTTGDMMKDDGHPNNVIRKALYSEAARMIFGLLVQENAANFLCA
ncbi:hypothetical protein SEMRO_3471_G348380.1 [Seminavis robusta]|uniref:Uncharacterized protein n=1 Tax=Seminavis robusta TaxID=568900 RepID=A0A9N8HZD8_9STRA|nr:hypothetical protein SEMRO_3471_G348380.1 [Seminavis robusta]|eukprot:Sro3471_g348380.1 n/a (114) ;mRNA; f:3795-4136